MDIITIEIVALDVIEKKIGHPVNKMIDYRITCILTKDHSEDVSFPFKFKGNYKLFNFGSKGRFTLKEVWDKVVITKVEYFEIF